MRTPMPDVPANAIEYGCPHLSYYKDLLSNTKRTKNFPK